MAQSPAYYKQIAKRAARKYGLDERIFLRQINAESGFNPYAGSPAGAQGIAQFMPGTAKSLGIDPMDPKQALNGAAKLMAGYVRKYKSYRIALAAYNAGEGAVSKYGGRIPPYAETQAYVRKIVGGIDNPTMPGQQPPKPKPAAQTGSQASPEAPPISLAAQVNPNPQVALSNPQLPQMLDPSKYLGNSASQSVPTLPQVPVQAAPEPAVAPVVQAPAAAPSPREEAPQPQARPKSSGRENPWKVPAEYGLVVTSGSRPGSITTSGNVSDHAGIGPGTMARDFGGSPKQMNRAAQRMAQVLGLNPKQVLKGGVFNVVKDGWRYQMIYRTNIGGNHYNHIHLGRRKA